MREAEAAEQVTVVDAVLDAGCHPRVEQRQACGADAVGDHAHAHAALRRADQRIRHRPAGRVVAEDVGFEHHLLAGGIDPLDQRPEELAAGLAQSHGIARREGEPRRGTAFLQEHLPQLREALAGFRRHADEPCGARDSATRAGSCRIASAFDGEAARGRLAERQPRMVDMLARRQRHVDAMRHAQAEPVLDVARDARGVAVQVLRIDRVFDLVAPVDERTGRHVRRADRDAGLFDHFARGGERERLVERVLRAGHRLPEIRLVGTLDHEHIEVGRVDHDKNGFGDFRRLRHLCFMQHRAACRANARTGGKCCDCTAKRKGASQRLFMCAVCARTHTRPGTRRVTPSAVPADADGCAVRAAGARRPETGACVSRSCARCVFGNAITSRIESAPAIIVTMRSRPNAIPPCGGAPYCSASSRKPNELRFFRTDLQRAEHLALHFLAVDTHRAAADFPAVQHHVVGLREATARIRLEVLEMLVLRAGERVVSRDVACIFVVVFEHREVDDPQRLPAGLDEAVRLAEFRMADLQAQRAEAVVDDLRAVGREEDDVAVLRAGALEDRRDRCVVQVLDDRPAGRHGPSPSR